MVPLPAPFAFRISPSLEEVTRRDPPAKPDVDAVAAGTDEVVVGEASAMALRAN
jgi:hypothetical protein